MTRHRAEARTIILLSSIFLFLASGLFDPVSQAEDLLLTEDFESHPAFVPTGWNLYGNPVWGTDAALTSTEAYIGKQSFMLVDPWPDRSIGLRSRRIEITDQGPYRASVSTLYDEQGQGSLFLEFWDEQGNRIDYRWVNGTATARNQWQQISVEAYAPANARFVTVLLYSSGGAVGTVLFDDVSLQRISRDATVNGFTVKRVLLSSSQYENLGQPIQLEQFGAGAQGWDLEGRPTWYFTSPGSGQDHLYAVRIPDGSLLGIYPYEAPSGGQSWAVLPMVNGDVYFTAGNTVFKFEHEHRRIQRIGSPNGMIWDLEIDSEGMIYGATYPESRIFRLNTATDRIEDLGPVSEQDYARSIAVSDTYVFVGLGPITDLIALHKTTGETVSILPERYKNRQGFIAYADVRGDRLFASAGDETNTVLVYDANTLQLIHTLPGVEVPVSPVDENGFVYFRQFSIPYRYDLKTDVYRSYGLVQPSARALGFATMDESIVPQSRRSRFQGPSLVGLEPGNFWVLNLQSFQILQVPIELRPSPNRIISLDASGEIVVGGGFAPGGMFVYDKKTNTYTNVPPVGQVDSLTIYGDRVYFGTYPRANLHYYDLNKNETITLGAAGQEQDRVGIMIEHNGWIYAGTIPGYGLLGGALVAVHTETGAIRTYRNIVRDHSVVALASGDDVVYGGTTPWGGLGRDITPSNGTLFAWDPSAERILWVEEPLDGETAIGALAVGDDGLLWGAGTNSFFAFDPNTRELVWKEVVAPGQPLYRGRGAEAVVFNEYVFISLGLRYLAIVNTASETISIVTGDFDHIAIDADGDLYLNRMTELYRVPYPSWALD